MLEISGGEEISCGPHTVRGLPSRHGKVALGRIPLPGIISSVPQWPMRVTAFRHGQVFNWHLNLNGVRIVHIDSADFIDEELGVERADILCLCAAGRKYRPDYVATAIELLKPSIVIPCHWDIFTTPIAAPPLLIPGIHLDGMMNEIRECGSRAVLLPILGEYGYSKTS
jgi:L-ascorbate metabolism protein UlaG (beta-lactamase superfamily)